MSRWEKIVANLLAMFVMSVIFLVVTLANYVIPIVIVGSIVWVALVFWLRAHRAISAKPGVVASAQPEPTLGPPASRARHGNLIAGTG